MKRKSAIVMNWRNRTKQKLIDYKGGKCSRCGYNKKVPAVYEFHHCKGEKDFTISGKSWSFARLKQEADKCVLLCANCHAEVHWELQQAVRQDRLQIQAKTLGDCSCKGCGRTFHPKKSNQLYCTADCYRVQTYKVEHPSLEELAADMLNLNWCAIGRKYGVSDNAARKWAKKYGLL